MMLQLNVDAILTSIGAVSPLLPEQQEIDFAALVTASAKTTNAAPGQDAILDQPGAAKPLPNTLPPEAEDVLAVVENMRRSDADPVEMVPEGKVALPSPTAGLSVSNSDVSSVDVAPAASNTKFAATSLTKEFDGDEIGAGPLQRIRPAPEQKTAQQTRALTTDLVPELMVERKAAKTSPKQQIDDDPTQVAQPVESKSSLVRPDFVVAMPSANGLPIAQSADVKVDADERPVTQARAKPFEASRQAEKPVEMAAIAPRALQDVVPTLAQPERRALRDIVELALQPTIADSPLRVAAPMVRSDLNGNTGSPVPDRGASLFSAHVAALAGDVMAVSAERDVRFNVRPEILGPVAVTIERRDDGAALRLGVENATTAQVVRQAEPVLSDAAARAGSPFIQISVDVQSSGQRDRPARVTAIMKRSGDVSLPEIEQAAVKSGRFA